MGAPAFFYVSMSMKLNIHCSVHERVVCVCSAVLAYVKMHCLHALNIDMSIIIWTLGFEYI